MNFEMQIPCFHLVGAENKLHITRQYKQWGKQTVSAFKLMGIGWSLRIAH